MLERITKGSIKRNYQSLSTFYLEITFHLKVLNKKSKMSSFKSNENIHKKEKWVILRSSANKASSVTL